MDAKKTMVFFLTAAMVAASAYAWAGPGRGWGGCAAGLSEEDAKKVEEARGAFHEETLPLRQKRFEKLAALRAEMAKETVDEAKAAALQKEISDLDAELDQKRLQHRIQMKSIVPYAGMGMGRGMGYGGCGSGRWGGGQGPCYQGKGHGCGGGPCGGGGGYGPGGSGCPRRGGATM